MTFSPNPLQLEQSGVSPEKHPENSYEDVHKWRPPTNQSSVPEKDLSSVLISSR